MNALSIKISIFPVDKIAQHVNTIVSRSMKFSYVEFLLGIDIHSDVRTRTHSGILTKVKKSTGNEKLW